MNAINSILKSKEIEDVEVTYLMYISMSITTHETKTAVMIISNSTKCYKMSFYFLQLDYCTPFFLTKYECQSERMQ